MSELTLERFESMAKDHRPAPVTPYDHAFRAFLDEWFAAYPTWATSLGYHEHDHRWPDLSGTGRLDRLRMLRRHREALEALPEDDLSADERIDRGIALEAIDGLLFDEEVLREETWDPLSYVYLMGSGLFPLLARDFAPFQHRGDAFSLRMRQIPDIVAAARQNLLGMPDRPVSLLHTETALAQLDGVAELFDSALEEAHRSYQRGDDTDHHRRLPEEIPVARAALDDFRAFLDTDVRARARGEGRLGGDLYRQKLRHTLSSDLSPDELLRRARRDYDVVRTEMVRLAKELWPVWRPDEALPDDAGKLVRGALDSIATEHPRPDELLEFCRRETARIERFVRRNEMIGLPREPLQITWTPVFMRAYGGAFLDSPGPLDRGQASYFWISPPEDDWEPERVESYLRENNDRMLRLLCIHEAIPGHYLQLSWSNRSPSLTRAILHSGMFAEGWAVYVTQVMMDVGYGSRDPSLMLVHWKFYLRCITNALIDVLIHTEGMTEEQAMELMVEGGFQEEQEARAKFLRARLTSTQLSTYYLGSVEFWDLELEARRAGAVAAGGSADDVAPARVVGQLGDTPGFEYEAHLERVLSHGTPPIKWVRRIVLGE
jgi:uncharacterized protein (DUF885 family)